ncbi:MAG: hypothetical protein KatS3mg103_0836 [Phycisphaerales bacterium]|nr:MAG: hypothetical protein KatS3mg103_0836 [Phycisphaerales bacterium]
MQTSPAKHLGLDPKVAYFSMEIGLEDAIPTYSGGLGVLAGDTIRSAADLGLPMVAVTLLHRGGYFKQTIAPDGTQQDRPVRWQPDKHLRPLEHRATLKLDGRTVHVAAWLAFVQGRPNPGTNTGKTTPAAPAVATQAQPGQTVVPVLFLDTDLPENRPEHRRITDRLYGGDDALRLRQEAVLGIAGVRMLQVLGCKDLKIYHMNEGHASLLVPELLRQTARRQSRSASDPRVLAEVRERCVFTTHTPVPAGHDRFPMALVHAILDPQIVTLLHPEPTGAVREAPVPATPPARRSARRTTRHAAQGQRPQAGLAVLTHDADHTPPTPKDAAGDSPGEGQADGVLNMTLTGFWGSGRINAVARRHAQVSRDMFARQDIQSITNGVHAGTWVCPAMARLFDKHLPGWREDNALLRLAGVLEDDALLDAHQRAKNALIRRVNARTGAGFDPQAFTIGFGRRATAYKRLTLLFSSPERLEAVAKAFGQLQVVLAGKAHPKDLPGQRLIAQAIEHAKKLKRTRVVYLPNYDMALCGLMTSGSDVWLNTPRPPLEASGTSGMKAALNGVPSLSTLDGWWLEGCIQGQTGWAIGKDDFAPGSRRKPPTPKAQDRQHAKDLYDTLQGDVLRAFGDKARWAEIMRQTIALNGAHFTTQRMVRDYVATLYFR